MKRVKEREEISIVTSLSDWRIFNERLLAISGNAAATATAATAPLDVDAGA